jgi:cytidylate kinase
MFNVITIAREYGSGGADIGRRVAKLLGWECVDKEILERVARMGRLDPGWAEAADEHCFGWWERVLCGFRQGGPVLALGVSPDAAVDYDQVQQVTATVIQEAARVGQCVIIGRGSQCVLRHHPEALHVLVYAPLKEKLERMKLRHPQEHHLRGLLQRMDSDRTHYTQTHYDCDWQDRQLYHLCVNSTLGIDAGAELIVKAIQLSR